MFASFTGNSRKPRNVNLSGQQAINPFTNPSWSSSSPTGASKTIAHAQAEREQRKRERDRIQATLRIQRSWRGHRVRRGLRASRRQLLDELYSETGAGDEVERSARALPLILAVYQAAVPEDSERLRRVAQDLVQTRFGAFTSGAVPKPRLNRLARVFLVALDRLGPDSLESHAPLFLDALGGVLERRPQALEPVLPQYYRALSRCCQSVGSEWESLDSLRKALVAPLSRGHADTFMHNAYRQFAYSFLTQNDLTLFEANVGQIAPDVDIDRLAEAITSPAPEEPKTPESQLRFLWLLAHFVDLHKASKQHALHLRYLRTLHLLLCISSTMIRDYFVSSSRSSGDDEADDARGLLPPYISKRLMSLNKKQEISGLLERFTLNQDAPPGSEFEEAGFLAAYILTLLHCFPPSADDIRMRLYLTEIPTSQGPLPAVKLFWRAMTQTSVFTTIATKEDAAVEVLRRHRLSKASESATVESKGHREWRTVLLFLELYIFILRLTDDDDFFAALDPVTAQHSGSRLRLSGLSKQEVMRLASFLKHLAFTLYYNQPETLFLDSDQRSNRLASNVALDSHNPVITAGIDFTSFRNLVSTAMKMLYERDSRRPFLPAGHWLMTSKFDMADFERAVLEEEKRRRSREQDSDDDENGEEGDDMQIDGPPAFMGAQQRTSHLASMELLRARYQKGLRDKMLAANGPKLEILKNMPFIIPFENRVQIFHAFVGYDMWLRRDGNIDPDMWRISMSGPHGHRHHGLGRHHAEIKRGQTFADAMSHFWKLEDGLKEPIQITFVDEFGMPEAGIDGGGVTKEFLTSITNEAFTQDHTLFVTNSKNAYYPNPSAMDQRKEALRAAEVSEDSAEWREGINDLLRQYEFLGRIIGKCMYEGILINIVFAPFFLLKWATSDTYRANINDLRELDEELYQGLVALKNYPGDVKDFGTDFTITDPVSLPDEPLRTVTHDLIPNGANTAVTNENRPLYISYVARHRLMVQPYQQTRAFLRGLNMIIDPGWLSMFNQSELQRLVGGDSSAIDVEDLRKNTLYSGVYVIGDDGEEHPTIKLFWQVMSELGDEERREVLQYVTSTPRAPLLGFSQLKPQFTIRDNGDDEKRLPSASTCINLLKLPRYKSAETLKSKLLYAVKSGAGFDLS